jgi:hypothetical protein
VPKRKRQLVHYYPDVINKLKKQFGFKTKKETMIHALLLLSLAADYAEEDGTIWIITKDGEPLGISFSR